MYVRREETVPVKERFFVFNFTTGKVLFLLKAAQNSLKKIITGTY